MGANEIARTCGYASIPAEDNPVVLDSSISEKKQKNRKKRCAYFFCCSNLEFDVDHDQEDKAKALSFPDLENDKSRTCLVMCFSNLEVGSKNKL